MAKNRRKRRQQHGSAWHWKQTDAWYFTEPGTRKRVPLFDENGERIRGENNKEAARVALARIRVADELRSPGPPVSDEWIVAKVCDVVRWLRRQPIDTDLSLSLLSSELTAS
jgi:hypothetical protein